MVSTRFSEGDGSIERVRDLRQNASPAETAMWTMVRGSAVAGCKFRRQQRIGPFFVDFVCQSARLILEIDGESHAQSADADQARTRFLEREGYRVVRFTNADVLTNPEGIYREVETALAPSPSHPAAPGGPLPLPQGERGL